MMARIGPIATYLLLVDHFGPIRDTIKSMVAATGIETKVLKGTRMIKVIRKFFLNHTKSFGWHIWDYEKHIFFPFEGL